MQPIPMPSVGRTVHYVSHGSPIRADGTQRYPSVCRAAIVTEVGEHLELAPEHATTVSLCVLNPEGLFFNRGVQYDDPRHPDGPQGGTWHWPEHVPAGDQR